jgi:hypothetical protein
MRSSLLTRTRQAWKLRLVVIGQLTSIVGLVAIGWKDGLEAPRHYQFFVALGILAVTTFILPSYIRCPRCHTSWYWLAAKTSRRGWYNLLKTQAICPICNYPAADRRT